MIDITEFEIIMLSKIIKEVKVNWFHSDVKYK